MPIAAAPFEALAAFGTSPVFLLFSSRPTQLTYLDHLFAFHPGFILLGLPLYYLTASTRLAPTGQAIPTTSRGRTESIWDRVQDFFGRVGGAGKSSETGGEGTGPGEGREEMVEMLGRRGGGGS